MKKEQLAFLIGGFAFGVLVGYGLFNALAGSPTLEGGGPTASVAAPSGPRAPTQQSAPAAGGDAPMMREINALKQRLQESPDDLAALVRLANLYHDVSMWEQALQFYERALEQRPDDPDLLTDAGVCYRGVQQYDKALEFFRRAHEADPEHYQCLFNTVVVAGFDLGRFEEARAAMERLHTFDPPPPRLAELEQALEQAMNAPSGG